MIFFASKRITRVLRRLGLPCIGAVVIQDLEVFSRYKFAAIDSRLNRAQSAEDANLLHVAHHGRYLQTFEFRVNGVQSADQVLEKEVKRLRETDELVAVDSERRQLCASDLDHFTLVVLRSVFHRRWSGVHGLVREAADGNARARGGEQFCSEEARSGWGDGQRGREGRRGRGVDNRRDRHRRRVGHRCRGQ